MPKHKYEIVAGTVVIPGYVGPGPDYLWYKAEVKTKGDVIELDDADIKGIGAHKVRRVDGTSSMAAVSTSVKSNRPAGEFLNSQEEKAVYTRVDDTGNGKTVEAIEPLPPTFGHPGHTSVTLASTDAEPVTLLTASIAVSPTPAITPITRAPISTGSRDWSVISTMAIPEASALISTVDNVIDLQAIRQAEIDGRGGNGRTGILGKILVRTSQIKNAEAEASQADTDDLE